MVLISGTTFSAMGVPKVLYKAIFIWCQNISFQSYFFIYFKRLPVKIYRNIFRLKTLNPGAFLTEQFRVIT